MTKQQYPVIVADITRASEDGRVFYIYKMDINQGFQVDGFAGELCAHFDGKEDLKNIVRKLEKKYDLEDGHFDSEIKKLLTKLESLQALQWLDKPLSKK